MPEDLGDERMAEETDPVARHTFTKERQPQPMSELSYHQPNQPSQQDQAPSYPSRLRAQGRRTAGIRTRFQTGPEHSRTGPQ